MAEANVFCSGCGLIDLRCQGACGRADDPPHFCRSCGLRLREIVIVPAWTALACPRHGPLAD